MNQLRTNMPRNYNEWGTWVIQTLEGKVIEKYRTKALALNNLRRLEREWLQKLEIKKVVDLHKK